MARWLKTTITRYPARFSESIASSTPGRTWTSPQRLTQTPRAVCGGSRRGGGGTGSELTGAPW